MFGNGKEKNMQRHLKVNPKKQKIKLEFKMTMFTLAAVLSTGIASESWAYDEDNCNCPGGNCICGATCSCYISRPDNKCGENCSYEIKNGVLTISGSGAMDDFGPLSGGTGTDNNPYMYNSVPWGGNFSTVVINGVSTIGANAFDSNEYIRNVTVGETVESIGYSAFGYTSNLETVTFAPNGKLKNFVGAAFEGSGVTSITIPDSVVSAEDCTFCAFGISEVNCVGSDDKCANLLTLLLENGLPEEATFTTVAPPSTSCPANTFSVGGECLPRRYTPAEAAKVVGESNTVILYYK